MFKPDNQVNFSKENSNSNFHASVNLDKNLDTGLFVAKIGEVRFSMSIWNGRMDIAKGQVGTFSISTRIDGCNQILHELGLFQFEPTRELDEDQRAEEIVKNMISECNDLVSRINDKASRENLVPAVDERIAREQFKIEMKCFTQTITKLSTLFKNYIKMSLHENASAQDVADLFRDYIDDKSNNDVEYCRPITITFF